MEADSPNCISNAYEEAEGNEREINEVDRQSSNTIINEEKYEAPEKGRTLLSCDSNYKCIQVPQMKPSKLKIVFLRFVLILTLLGSGAMCGYFGYKITKDLQHKIFIAQYNSITDQMHQLVTRDLMNKVTASRAFASALGILCPYQHSWPNCTLPTRIFDELALSLQKITKLNNIGSVFRLNPSNKDGFEEFAYDFYKSEISQGYLPEGVGLTDAGEGVWYVDKYKNVHLETDGCHNPTNPTDCGINPVVQFTKMKSHPNMAMFNTHMNPPIAAATDAITKCFESGADSCEALITEINPYQLYSLWSTPVFSPSSGTYVPIFPAGNKSNIVGFVSVRNDWDDTFNSKNIPNYIDLTLVLSTYKYDITYNLTDTKMNASGFGDLHNPKFSHYRNNYLLTPMTGLGGIAYNLTFYPTQAFYDYYIDPNVPIFVCIGAVAVIVLTSIIILTYSWLESTEAVEKDQVIEAKANFINFISHEIRTPMTTVCLGLRLMLDQLQTMEQENLTNLSYKDLLVEYQRLVIEAIDNSDEAVNTLSNLLNYHKLEKRQLQFEVDFVRVWKIFEEALNPLRAFAFQNDVNLSIFLQPDKVKDPVEFSRLMNVYFYCDKHKIIHAIRTIVRNSIKFTAPNKPVSVTATWIPDQPLHNYHESVSIHDDNFYECGHLKIEIVDSGPGLTEYEVKEAQSSQMQILHQETQTNGIGLWMARKYFELHRGSIDVSSPGLNLGSCFVLRIPVHVCHNPHLIEKVDIVDYVKRILVVDDSSSNRRILQKQLQNAKFSVEVAVDGSEALEKIKDSSTYDLILIDNHMTVMHGPETVRRLRKRGIQTIIIGITGDSDDPVFLQSGVNDVIVKPATNENIADSFSRIKYRTKEK